MRVDCGACSSAGDVVEERRVAAPPALELLAREPPPADGRVDDLNVPAADGDQHDPVVFIPMHDRWKRHVIEMPCRGLDRPRGQPQLFAGTAD